jgi:chromosome segregation ATPase
MCEIFDGRCLWCYEILTHENIVDIAFRCRAEQQLRQIEEDRKTMASDAKEVADSFAAAQQAVDEKEELLSALKAPYDKFKKSLEKLQSKEVTFQGQLEEIDKRCSEAEAKVGHCTRELEKLKAKKQRYVASSVNVMGS